MFLDRNKEWFRILNFDFYDIIRTYAFAQVRGKIEA